MFEDLSAAPTCDGDDCERPLSDPRLAFRTSGGERRAYECVCGAVTVSVARAAVEE